MLTIFLLIAMAFFVGLTVRGTVRGVKNKREFGRVFPTSTLTIPSQHLFREYRALPADSRPFPDIVRVLEGLDAEHTLDGKELMDHFNVNRGRRTEGYSFSWTAARCGHTRCEFKTYPDMHDAINSVARAVADKERAFITAKYAGRGDAAEQLIEALRQEASIQRQVIGELQ